MQMRVDFSDSEFNPRLGQYLLIWQCNFLLDWKEKKDLQQFQIAVFETIYPHFTL